MDTTVPESRARHIPDPAYKKQVDHMSAAEEALLPKQGYDYQLSVLLTKTWLWLLD